MAKEKENPEVSAADVQATPTKRDKWLSNMRAKYPDIQDEDELYGASMEGYDQEHEYSKRSREDNQRIADAIGDDPDLAALYAEIYERGAGGHPELALLNISDLLKRYISGEISSDEYVAEKEKRSKEKKERESNIEKQQKIVEEWCAKKGYDVDEWMQKLREKILDPLAGMSLAEAQLDALDNMLNYDEDIAAAELRGRNANVSAQRKSMQNRSDGLPRAASSAGGSKMEENDFVSRLANKRALEKNL